MEANRKRVSIATVSQTGGKGEARIRERVQNPSTIQGARERKQEGSRSSREVGSFFLGQKSGPEDKKVRLEGDQMNRAVYRWI